MLIRPSAVGIPGGSPRRRPTRAEHLRSESYADRFDADTLYFDVFRQGASVVAVGPPLVNLDDRVSGWAFSSDAGRLAAPRIVRLDRQHRAEFAVPAGASELIIEDDASRQVVPIGSDLSSVFAGTRAMMTLQLDNDLAWIRDWVRWHVRAHGTDAVVVYDNGSTRYGLRDVLDAISQEGIRAAAVVDWSYPFGPQGGGDLPWDSDFTQYGAIEHARRRLLRKAAGMLSVDIDEMVYPARDLTAYECAERAPQGFALFSGVWSYADPDAVGAEVRHADCQWLRPGDADAATKWCAVPSRLPRGAQLGVHGAHGLTMPPTSPLSYWHMRPISTHWKFDRTASRLAGETLEHSPLIAQQVERYLGSQEMPARRPLRTTGPAGRVSAGLDLVGWRLRRLVHRLRRR